METRGYVYVRFLNPRSQHALSNHEFEDSSDAASSGLGPSPRQGTSLCLSV